MRTEADHCVHLVSIKVPSLDFKTHNFCNVVETLKCSLQKRSLNTEQDCVQLKERNVDKLTAGREKELHGTGELLEDLVMPHSLRGRQGTVSSTGHHRAVHEGGEWDKSRSAPSILGDSVWLGVRGWVSRVAPGLLFLFQVVLMEYL